MLQTKPEAVIEETEIERITRETGEQLLRLLDEMVAVRIKADQEIKAIQDDCQHDFKLAQAITFSDGDRIIPGHYRFRTSTTEDWNDDHEIHTETLGTSYVVCTRCGKRENLLICPICGGRVSFEVFRDVIFSIGRPIPNEIPREVLTRFHNIQAREGSDLYRITCDNCQLTFWGMRSYSGTK